MIPLQFALRRRMMMGAAPSVEASKTYEFDVLDGVWAVQEVVSA